MTEIKYKNWTLKTQMQVTGMFISAKHSQDDFFRYHYPIGQRGMVDTIGYAKTQIDLMEDLEQLHSDREFQSIFRALEML